MAKLEKKPKKKPKNIRKGHINYSKRKQWRYDKSDKKWVLTKRGKRVRGIAIVPPAPPPKKVTPEKVIVRTARPSLSIATTRNAQVDTKNRDAMDAFKALSSVELFQFLNNQTIEGMESNEGISSMLTSIRSNASTIRSMDTTVPLVKNTYLTSNNRLAIEFNDTIDRHDIVVEFYTTGIEKIWTWDYE